MTENKAGPAPQTPASIRWRASVSQRCSPGLVASKMCGGKLNSCLRSLSLLLQTDRTYRAVLERYSKSVKLLNSYGNFLEEVRNDPVGAKLVRPATPRQKPRRTAAVSHHPPLLRRADSRFRALLLTPRSVTRRPKGWSRRQSRRGKGSTGKTGASRRRWTTSATPCASSARQASSRSPTRVAPSCSGARTVLVHNAPVEVSPGRVRRSLHASLPFPYRPRRYKTDELIGKNISMLMPSPYSQQHNTYLRRYMANGVVRLTLSCDTCDRCVHGVRIRRSPLCFSHNLIRLFPCRTLLTVSSSAVYSHRSTSSTRAVSSRGNTKADTRSPSLSSSRRSRMAARW